MRWVVVIAKDGTSFTVVHEKSRTVLGTWVDLKTATSAAQALHDMHISDVHRLVRALREWDRR